MGPTIYLFPRDGLGGVEQAIRSAKTLSGLIEFCCMSGKALDRDGVLRELNPARGVNSVYIYFVSFFFLIRRKPQVLICSLWRATLLGLIYKLIRPSVKLVVVVHSSKFSNVCDLAITRLAAMVCFELWCDSNATYAHVVRFCKVAKIHVLSYYLGCGPSSPLVGRGLDVIFWGRINPVKRLSLAVSLFSSISKFSPSSRFFIYGPDGGDLEKTQQAVRENNLEDRVFFMGEKLPGSYPNEVETCSFFLNCSEREGMAISVVEAMAIGLIPIVTPVGEIARYCIDGVNSLVIDSPYSDNEVVSRVVDVMNDDVLRTTLSNQSKDTWSNATTYHEDLERNVLRVLVSRNEA